ncbi:hypothetical protein OEZ86_005280 [Tetradesmus obliquus]|nr:hypothetical protein OEZ86_005280 [Tetradesmus obliquus]
MGGLKRYSITQEFKGATVLVTGATGYIGSLVVEQLLRTTAVSRIFLLVRGKRGTSSQERIAKVLRSGLFHLVRDDPKLLSKVVVAEGDLNSEQLGLSEATMQQLLEQVDIIIHSAASIGLEADVQATLRCNYLGTQRLLALAAAMPRLRCFLHVSTAYVNMNLERGATVDEVLYPLAVGRQASHFRDVVEDLLSMDPEGANVRAQMYMDMWGFPNTYTLGKNLTEKLVAAAHRSGLPTAIVRPSLVCGLAGAPYPGYCGNLAGPVGMGVAMAVGLFDKLESVAMVPTHVWDAVPGDVVSSVILTAAAATAAGLSINEYAADAPESVGGPLIVHAGTSTTYPVSMAEASYASVDFLRANPAPFKLPGSSLFKIPLDYVPDEAAVKRRKYWTGWKVWAAVHLLQLVRQKKTAHRLKYGYLAWEVMNSSKTDVNIFFSSRNLLQLEALLDEGDADSRLFKITWTLKEGGWHRYIATQLAGMYRQVFGIGKVKGLKYNDFRFIPNQPITPADIAAVAAADSLISSGSSSSGARLAAAKQQQQQQQQQVEIQPQLPAAVARHPSTQGGQPSEQQHLLQQLLQPHSSSSSGGSSDASPDLNNVITSTYIGGAAAFIKVPASGSERFSFDLRQQQQQQQQQQLDAAPELAASLSEGAAGVGYARRAITLPPAGMLVKAAGDGAQDVAGAAADAVKASAFDTAAGAAAASAACGGGIVPRKQSAGAVLQRVLNLNKPKQQQLLAASPAGIAAASPAGVADLASKKDV